MSTVGDWRDRALCAAGDLGSGGDWFGNYRERYPREHVKAVRAICDRCPVQYECLLFALSVPAQHDRVGIFGGLTPAERRDLRDDPAVRLLAEADDEVWVGGTTDGSRPGAHHRSA